MTTNQLKKLLISKIDDTNDDELLKAVYKILDFNSTAGGTLILSNEQKTSIKEGLEQIEEGNVISDEELEKEIDEWLSK